MIRFIVNPAARSGQGLDIFRKLEEEMTARDVPYETYLTECPGDGTRLAGAVAEKLEGGDILGVVGGDGTMSEVAAGLPEGIRCPLFYLPGGSGNDFARGLGLEPTFEEAAVLLASPDDAVRQKVDISRACFPDGKERCFVVSSGIGYDAQVCWDISQSKLKKGMNQIRLGNLSYLLIGLKDMFTCPLVPAEIINEDNGETIRTDHLGFVSVQNLPYEGGGFRFAPDARSDDGLLDVCVMTAPNHFRLIVLLLKATFGAKHIGKKGVYSFRASRIRIRAEKPLPVHTDGEVPGFFSEILCRAKTGNFKLLRK